ncbi:hypothetical protein QYS48_29705 [Marivirga arenosa]|nr:hypothetical protein [Marivirga sp. ABR2-2]WMN07734.1 hypothetical protein QYS48_29705 [Marivirga sp. ABR2-2]
MKLKDLPLYLIGTLVSIATFTSCGDEITEVTEVIYRDTTITVTNTFDTTIIINNVGDSVFFTNRSNLEPLVAVSPQFNFVKAYSLLSSSDTLENRNGDLFRLGGSADGAGLLKNGDEYVFMVNCEDHYSVARVFLDKNFKPIQGDYMLNSGVADLARQCSGTMWESEIHGGSQDLFLSASESFNYDVKGIDPYMTPNPTADFGLDALGEFSWENAVPLPKNTYAGKTVIIGGDDDSSDSEGQVSLYFSENGDADLENGDIYVLKMKDSSRMVNEGEIAFGETYDVEFVKIEGGKEMTKNEMEDASIAANAFQFMRVEDVDYGKGSDAAGRNVYFAVTGRGPGRGTYNDWGTVYKLELDEASPLNGKLTQIISGNTDTNNMDGNLSLLQSPDNICVTENFIYTQEDPNSFSRNHSAYIYQSDLNGNNPRVVLELVERADLSRDKNISNSGEFGALIDISDKIGVPNTFMLAVQPHYWEDDAFKGVDGHNNEGNSNGSREDDQGSQIVILYGLPR